MCPAGDCGAVTIGQGSNVQDDAVLCAGDVSIGEGVTIGHGAIIKARMGLHDPACDA